MLANYPINSSSSGNFQSDMHHPATLRNELINFIADQLPRWRDEPDRPYESAETTLNTQLCSFLIGACHQSQGWDFFQFRVEEKDAIRPSRKIDLVASPLIERFWVEGRSYNKYQIFMPIECKRLPTPIEKTGKTRDEREYIFSQFSKAGNGGIQRFKAGHHASDHNLVVMIGYVQKETIQFWNVRIAEWINALANSGQNGWSEDDLLHLITEDANLRVASLSSSHKRESPLEDIEIRHLWIKMD